ncbi:hypothetical protein BGZ96_004899, partial [Linnemannia gamsii]
QIIFALIFWKVIIYQANQCMSVLSRGTYTSAKLIIMYSTRSTGAISYLDGSVELRKVSGDYGSKVPPVEN